MYRCIYVYTFWLVHMYKCVTWRHKCLSKQTWAVSKEATISPHMVQGESWQHQDTQLPVLQQEQARDAGLSGLFQCCLKWLWKQTKGNCWEALSPASQQSRLGSLASWQGSNSTHTSWTDTTAILKKNILIFKWEIQWFIW